MRLRSRKRFEFERKRKYGVDHGKPGARRSSGGGARLHKTAARAVADSVTFSEWETYDVFLSHSVRDAEIVLGVVALLKGQGLSVYVDWIVDPELDRSQVTAATAERLRTRMQRSRSLIYLHTENSPHSKWMPWELGYVDGHTGRVAIFPVVKNPSGTFRGQEYLGIYPYVDGDRAVLWVNKPAGYEHIRQWAA